MCESGGPCTGSRHAAWSVRCRLPAAPPARAVSAGGSVGWEHNCAEQRHVQNTQYALLYSTGGTYLLENIIRRHDLLQHSHHRGPDILRRPLPHPHTRLRPRHPHAALPKGVPTARRSSRAAPWAALRCRAPYRANCLCCCTSLYGTSRSIRIPSLLASPTSRNPIHFDLPGIDC